MIEVFRNADVMMLPVVRKKATGKGPGCYGGLSEVFNQSAEATRTDWLTLPLALSVVAGGPCGLTGRLTMRCVHFHGRIALYELYVPER